jgi:site-specific recombinase XerD
VNDLTLIQPGGVPGNLSVEEIDRTMHFVAQQKAPSTRLAYESDWKSFSIWCLARGAQTLPANSGHVAAYIAHCADSGLRASSISRRVAAIADRHKQAGYDPSPTASAGVKATLAGVRREIGAAKKGKAAATADIIGKMMAAAPDNMIGLRDKALLAICFSAALRRSELVAIQVDDLTDTPDGIRLRIRRSKTDAEGIGVDIAIPRGCRICPVEMLKTYMTAAKIESGPVFRPVRLGGKVSDQALKGDTVARIVKRYIKRLGGLDVASFSAHSLRAGFITSAAEAGASIWKISEVSRHASVDVLRGYIRSVELFKEHAGSSFL